MRKWILSLCLVLTSPLAVAETAYISDVLTVPLRSGPSNAHRILHRGLVSGTALEVLSEDEGSGFAQVRTEGGMEGWLPSQYLVHEPIARDRLRGAKRRIAELESRLAARESTLSKLEGNSRESAHANEALTARVSKLTAELAEIRRVSAGALAQHAENERLVALNERLREEVERLIRSNRDLTDNTQRSWLLTGGALVLVGLLLGALFKSRPRRSGWS